ncbi:diguanylate cyclase [Clostridiaceae bacterium]|nr:diguanylate cyclase [Clostridiaceae bacterium]
MSYINGKDSPRQTILIADDSEMNRSILTDMLGDEYEIIEAENGVEAVSILQKYGNSISLLLLDIVMPEMDGFGVLTVMNKHRWIEDIPVIVISAENASVHVERAYELGVTEFISRPFDALILHRRVVNTILLYAKQKRLIDLVADQIYEKEQQSGLMVDILSHIVEFRNGESGLHVLHIRTLTEILLKHLGHRNSLYQLPRTEISLICTASALHDIGKISIPGEILNKPGRLTDEEFAEMKKHTLIGAEMLKALPMHQQEPLIKKAYEICRWHHERYDGRGYPDGLKGNEIPISAQVVALADVYDALTSERVYKKAFSHEVAVKMILDGQCGTFNPILMECLKEVESILVEELRGDSDARASRRQMQNVAEELLRHEDLSASERTLQLLEHERMKYSFFADMSEEIQFEYTVAPSMVTLSPFGAKKLGLDEILMDPHNNPEIQVMMGSGTLRALSNELRSTTPEHPQVKYDHEIYIHGEKRWMRTIGRAMWSADEPPRYMGAIGKTTDIHDERTRIDALVQMASHDSLTGLFNHNYARERIRERMEDRQAGVFALAIFDLDHFKSANDNYGHMFGDKVLIHMAEQLRRSTRGGDIAARVGGDEFLIFLEYKEDAEAVVQRIFTSLEGTYEDFRISVSMGVVRTDAVGTDYDTLFHAADQALYAAKRSGRGQYRFYDDTMQEMLSVISPIDGSEEKPVD